MDRDRVGGHACEIFQVKYASRTNVEYCEQVHAPTLKRFPLRFITKLMFTAYKFVLVVSNAYSKLW